jgi:hypothetical protein
MVVGHGYAERGQGSHKVRQLGGNKECRADLGADQANQLLTSHQTTTMKQSERRALEHLPEGR